MPSPSRPPVTDFSTAADSAPLHAGRPGDRPLDLREIDLRDGQFSGADLTDADLSHACLAGADLSGAVLRGARLLRADLTLAKLVGADLSNADLSGADLSGADLSEAQLAGADLHDAEWGWAKVQGARGLPHDLLARSRSDGRLQGAAVDGDTGEPLAGLTAYRRGERAHTAGELGLAERHFSTALRWVPESDAARYALGAVALDRGDADGAAAWWAGAVRADPAADRARLDLAVLRAWQGQWDAAVELLEPLTAKRDAADWAIPALDAGRHADLAELTRCLARKVPDSPGLRWARRPPVAAAAAPADDVAVRVGDEAWVAAERLDIEGQFRVGDRTVAAWHATIARAIAIGALDLAWRAEQRLTRIAPEQRLWGLELRQLDVTAQAIESLVRTRRGPLGKVLAVRWVALGIHGPTARVVCEGGTAFAKRYSGISRPAASVAYTHRVCRELARRGLEVPAALEDRAGDDTMRFGDDLLALYPDLAGTSIRGEDLDAATAERLGALLGQVHRLGAEFGGAGRPRGGARVGSRTVRHSSPAQAWLATLGQDPQCAAEFDRHPLAARLGSLIDATGRRLRAVVADCPPGLCHGDFGAGNVLHLTASPDDFAVIDWDLCDVDLLAWDLARTVDLLAVRWPQDPSRPAEVRHPILQALVRGYHAERPLNRAERRALPVLIAASRLDLDASILPMCVRLEPDMLPPVVERQIVRLSRAVAGAPDLAASVTSALGKVPSILLDHR